MRRERGRDEGEEKKEIPLTLYFEVTENFNTVCAQIIKVHCVWFPSKIGIVSFSFFFLLLNIVLEFEIMMIYTNISYILVNMG